MKNIKEFITNPINESRLATSAMKYIISSYYKNNEVVKACEELSEVEEFIHDNYTESVADDIMNKVKKLKSNEFLFYESISKTEFVLVNRL